MANPNMQVGMPSVNPKGRPVGIFHTLGDRRAHFLATLSRGEILALAADDKRLDSEYKAFDAQVIIGLAESLEHTPDDKLDPSKERERLYDRELGKTGLPNGSSTTVNLTQVTINISSTNNFLADLAGDGASETICGDVQERPVLPAPLRTE